MAFCPNRPAVFCDTSGVIPSELLLRAYATGWFPMAQDSVPGSPIEWFSPDPRGGSPYRRQGLTVAATQARPSRSS